MTCCGCSSNDRLDIFFLLRLKAVKKNHYLLRRYSFYAHVLDLDVVEDKKKKCKFDSIFIQIVTDSTKESIIGIAGIALGRARTQENV